MSDLRKNMSKWVNTRVEYLWSEEDQKYVRAKTEGYWYNGPWTLAHDIASVWSAEDYRWRNDDGSITAATWIAAENTAVSSGVFPGDNVRLRVNFAETAGAAGSGLVTGGWTLQFSKNSGAWTTVGSATDVKFFNSTNLTNGTVISTANHVLTQSWSTNAQAWGDENEDGVTPSFEWSDDHAEAEFSVQFDTTNTAVDDVITFRLLDPAGAATTFTNIPTITLSAAIITHTASGSPSAYLPTASGVAKIIKSATGAALIALITASGVSEVINSATGAPSTPLITSSGSADVDTGVETATGSPFIAIPKASGSSFIWPKVYLNTTKSLSGATEMTVTAATAAGTSITFDDALGAPTGSLFLGVENRVNGDVGWIAVTVTVSGADNTATGAPSIVIATASSLAEIIKTASGTPQTTLITAQGTGEGIHTADGSSSIIIPTTSGVAEIIKTSSGAPQTTLITAQGTGEGIHTADGSPSAFLPTSSGSATVTRFANGAPFTVLITSQGTASIEGAIAASGEPSLAIPTVSGLAEVINIANGSPSTLLVTSQGTASVSGAIGANGSPILIIPITSGIAEVINLADGSPSSTLLVSSGVAEIIKTADGGPSVFLPTSNGSAKISRSANGAPSILLITSQGTAGVEGISNANGSPSVFLPTSSGAAKVSRSSDGSVNVFLPTASGAANVTRKAGGNPLGPLPTASGLAEIVFDSSGAPDITLPIASGIASIVFKASGSPNILIPTVLGSTKIVKTADGTATVPLLVSSGLAEAIKIALGSPTIELPVTTGIANVQGFINTFGAPIITIPTVSGIAITSSDPISDYVTEIRDVQSRFTNNWSTTPIQWGNVAIETSSLTEWVRFINDSESSVQKSFGSNPDIYRYFGKITVEINVRPNSGANRALQLADSVSDIWRSATFTTIRMDVPELVVNGIEKGWYQVSVVCPYYRDSIQSRSV